MYFLKVLCALAVALLCTDVEAKRYIKKEDLNPEKPFKLPNREIKDYETSMFMVKCKGNCNVTEIQVFDYTGTLELSAESATTIICSGKKSRCPYRKVLTEKKFFIYLKPNPSFTGGKLRVKLEDKQRGKIIQLRHEGAFFSNPNSVRIFSGYHPVRYPKLLPQYMFTCDGNCNISRIEGTGDRFMIAASDEPLYVNKSTCHNCFCESSRSQGSNKLCKDGDTSSFNLQSNSFYVTLLPDLKVRDVQAFVIGSNFKAITRLDSNMLESRYTVLYHYYPQDPGTHAKKSMLVVLCGRSHCKDVKVDVLGGPKVKTMRVGRLHLNGLCDDCITCTGASCQRIANPKVFKYEDKYNFNVFIETEVGDLKSPAYVRVSGETVYPPLIKYW